LNSVTHPASGNIPNAAQAPFPLDLPLFNAVESVRRVGPLSRSEIADRLSYSRSKITTVVGDLIETGILEEVGDGDSTGGRRPRFLDFNANFGYVVGIDLGASSLDIAIADFKGQIVDRQYMPSDVREGPDAILALIRNILLDRIDHLSIPSAKIYGIGIGVPGPVEFSTGLLIAPPIMPGWEAFPIKAFFVEAFPAAVVIVDNDVNVMAMGELRGGAGRSEENFLFVKVGTGIGCGIVCNGHIYRGSNGCAGDIGHICADYNGTTCHCGNVGCLEAMAAGPAIAALAKEAALTNKSVILAKYLTARDGELTAEDVGAAASEGDRVANEIIRDSGRMIGEVLASLVNFFNPSLILIGGGVSKIGHQFLASIRRGVLHRSLPLSTRHLRIDTSQMGPDAGVNGAIALALEHVFVEAA
jgi:glucokinase-like ROK family protein